MKAPWNECTLWGYSVCVAGICKLLCILKLITNISLGTWASDSHFSLSVPQFPYMKVRIMSLVPLGWTEQAQLLNVKYYNQSQVYHICSTQPFKIINIKISHSKISNDCRSPRLWNMNLSDFNGCDASLRGKISFNVIWKILTLQWQMIWSASSVSSGKIYASPVTVPQLLFPPTLNIFLWTLLAP